MASRRRDLDRELDETRVAPDDALQDARSRKLPEPEPEPESDYPDETRVAPLTRVGSLDVSALGPAPAEPGDEGEDREPNYDVNRTMFSYQAALFADVLKDRFANKMFGRTPRRVLRVDEPEGPSTAGGLLARQNISLVPRRGAGQSIVCGWMDVSRKEALLRSYESLAARHEARHGGIVLDLSLNEYEQFLDELVDTLIKGGIRVRVLVPDEKPAEPPIQEQPVRGRSISAGLAVLLAVLAFGLGLVVERMEHPLARLIAPTAAPDQR